MNVFKRKRNDNIYNTYNNNHESYVFKHFSFNSTRTIFLLISTRVAYVHNVTPFLPRDKPRRGLSGEIKRIDLINDLIGRLVAFVPR